MTDTTEQQRVRQRDAARTRRRGMRHSIGTGVACAWLGLVLVATLFGPLISLADPNAFLGTPLAGPSGRHLLGTDHLGRDVLSRLVWGARDALLVAVVAALLALAIGVLLGSVAGYVGGAVDDVLSRTFDITLVIPPFFLLILVAALFGGSDLVIAVVIGATSWPSTARIMRSQVLTYKRRTYVDAARMAGGRSWYLLTRTIAPNCVSPAVTNGTILMGQAILISAGLSYLGLGDPASISWGRMIYEGQEYLLTDPRLALSAGFAISASVLALNTLGDVIVARFSAQATFSGTS